jgi:hypothetical protein
MADLFTEYYKLDELVSSPSDFTAADVSSYITIPTINGVILRVQNPTGSTETFKIRQPGSSDDITGLIHSNAAPYFYIGTTNKQFEYVGDCGSGGDLDVHLAGYFTGDFTPILNNVDVSIDIAGEWRKKVLTQVPIGTRFAVIQIEDAFGYAFSFRYFGFNDVRTTLQYGQTRKCMALVPLDGDRQFEAEVEHLDVKFRLRGYITRGYLFRDQYNHSHIDSAISLTGISNYENIDWKQLWTDSQEPNARKHPEEYRGTNDVSAVIVEPYGHNAGSLDYHLKHKDSVSTDYESFINNIGNELIKNSSDNIIKAARSTSDVYFSFIGALLPGASITTQETSEVGKFKFGYNFVDAATITSDNENSSYPATNIQIYNHTKRHFRSDSTSSDVHITLDFGSLKSIQAILLNDVNFTSVVIQGNDTDSWATPSYGASFNILKDERTQRYKLYQTLTNFSYRYMRIVITSGIAITDGADYYRIGSFIALDTIYTLTRNVSWPYDYSSDDEAAVVKYKTGVEERINLGELLFECSFGFKTVSKDEEAEIWTLNSFKKDENIILFENTADTTKAYLCRRETPIKVSERSAGYSSIKTIKFKEVY